MNDVVQMGEPETLQCSSSREGHSPEVDRYYCTDGSIVPLCANHLRDCTVVVWDGDHPMTVKYYEEVYSKKFRD